MIKFTEDGKIPDKEYERLSRLPIDKKIEIFKALHISTSDLFKLEEESFERAIANNMRSTFEYRGKARLLTHWIRILAKIREIVYLNDHYKDTPETGDEETIRSFSPAKQ